MKNKAIHRLETRYDMQTDSIIYSELTRDFDDAAFVRLGLAALDQGMLGVPEQEQVRTIVEGFFRRFGKIDKL